MISSPGCSGRRRSRGSDHSIRNGGRRGPQSSDPGPAQDRDLLGRSSRHEGSFAGTFLSRKKVLPDASGFRNRPQLSFELNQICLFMLSLRNL